MGFSSYSLREALVNTPGVLNRTYQVVNGKVFVFAKLESLVMEAINDSKYFGFSINRAIKKCLPLAYIDAIDAVVQYSIMPNHYIFAMDGDKVTVYHQALHARIPEKYDNIQSAQSAAARLLLGEVVGEDLPYDLRFQNQPLVRCYKVPVTEMMLLPRMPDGFSEVSEASELGMMVSDIITNELALPEDTADYLLGYERIFRQMIRNYIPHTIMKSPEAWCRLSNYAFERINDCVPISSAPGEEIAHMLRRRSPELSMLSDAALHTLYIRLMDLRSTPNFLSIDMDEQTLILFILMGMRAIYDCGQPAIINNFSHSTAHLMHVGLWTFAYLNHETPLNDAMILGVALGVWHVEVFQSMQFILSGVQFIAGHKKKLLEEPYLDPVRTGSVEVKPLGQFLA